MALSSCGLIIACGLYPGEQRAAWRDEAEKACMRSGYVQPSEKIVAVEPIGSYGCGMSYPFKVSELPQSRVALSKPTTMACQMVPALDAWVKDVVQPAARQHFGSEVTEVETVGSYSCRRINGSYSMSEHSFGNAMDVSGFKLADGRRVKVGKGFVAGPDNFEMSASESASSIKPREEWEQLVLDSLGEGDGEPPAPPYKVASSGYHVPPPAQDQDLAFLDQVRTGACSDFSTVLGPGQADHEDHLHVDLAHRKSGKRVCK
jgi:hypothetical protein